jgi:SCY1-like protein 2
MGSQLNKNFEVQSECKTEGGIACPWKIYSATRRDREKTPVSIFIFEKKDKKAETVARMKNEITNQLKLRHPNILQILEPLMEDANTLTWISEPVKFCVGDLIRRPAILGNTLGDTEIRLGILDVVQGLSFLHNEARLVHFAVCPDNIYISSSGKWKLGGLSFANTYTQETPARIDIDILQNTKHLKFQNDIDKISPSAYYTSPEVISSSKGTPQCDLFSLGCSIFSIYRSLSGDSELNLLSLSEFSIASHASACKISSLSSNPCFSSLPEGLSEIIWKLTSINPSERGSLHELSLSKSLQTPYVKTIYYLEHLQEKQEGQKMQFFKGLTSIISKFDKVIMNKRLLPALVLNMQQASLTPFILPSLLTILKNCEVTSALYHQQIWPAVSRLITGKEIPAQSFYLILSEIDLLVKYTDLDPCKKVLMPLVFKGYDCAVGEIQTAIMVKTPDLIKELKDFTFVRQQVLPRFLQGIVNSKTTSVKEAGLKTLSVIFPLFDRATMVETIIPSLEKFKKFDITGPMVMHLLTVYEGISKTLGHKATSVNILPALIPLLVEAELTRPEFDRLFLSMNSMLGLIREARYGELVEVKEEQIVENLRGEDIEEVNEIFKDIFDVAGKPILEAPDFEGISENKKISGGEKSENKEDFNIKGLESFSLAKITKSEIKKVEEVKVQNFQGKETGLSESTNVKPPIITKPFEPPKVEDDLFAELATRKEEMKPSRAPMTLKPRQPKAEESKATVKFAVKKPAVVINTDDFFNEFLK